MSNLKKAYPKILAAVLYMATHRKQLASAVAFGALVLEAAQKAH